MELSILTDPYYIWNSKIEHSYKTEIYSRELFTPKYRSPLFLFSKSKTENINGWLLKAMCKNFTLIL